MSRVASSVQRGDRVEADRAGEEGDQDPGVAVRGGQGTAMLHAEDECLIGDNSKGKEETYMREPTTGPRVRLRSTHTRR